MSLLSWAPSGACGLWTPRCSLAAEEAVSSSGGTSAPTCRCLCRTFGDGPVEAGPSNARPLRRLALARSMPGFARGGAGAFTGCPADCRVRLRPPLGLSGSHRSGTFDDMLARRPKGQCTTVSVKGSSACCLSLRPQSAPGLAQECVCLAVGACSKDCPHCLLNEPGEIIEIGA